MKRYLVSLGVFMLVVVLPAGSWYYLKTGLDYRKAALDQLKPKGVFDQSLIGDGRPLRSKTSLIQLDAAATNISKRLYDQFGEGETFTLWSPFDTAVGKENWNVLASDVTARLSMAYPEYSFMVVDTSGTIRNYYTDADEATIKELVSHVAIVMPRKKEKDIKMKKTYAQ